MWRAVLTLFIVFVLFYNLIVLVLFPFFFFFFFFYCNSNEVLVVKQNQFSRKRLKQRRKSQFVINVQHAKWQYYIHWDELKHSNWSTTTKGWKHPKEMLFLDKQFRQVKFELASFKLNCVSLARVFILNVSTRFQWSKSLK